MVSPEVKGLEKKKTITTVASNPIRMLRASDLGNLIPFKMDYLGVDNASLINAA